MLSDTVQFEILSWLWTSYWCVKGVSCL